MNYLTHIRHGANQLLSAYSQVQKGDSGKREALRLIEEAEKNIQLAKSGIMDAIKGKT